MIEREDGPIKHYRMVCDSCKKRTKRFAYSFDFEDDAPKGWVQKENVNPSYEDTHLCPKCASSTSSQKEAEVVPNVGDSSDISDHEAVYRPLTRESSNLLVIDLEEAGKWYISSETPIKVVHKEK